MRKLRSIVPALLAASALAVAGCGEDEAASALDEALGYLPEDAGFAFIASTDTGDYEGIEDLTGKFPFGGQARELLERGLESEGVDYEEDIKPLLGNYLVVGVADNKSFVDSSSDTPFVMALETGDADKLRKLVEADGEERDGAEGYDIFENRDGDSWIAVKDEIAVLSNGEDELKRALEQRGADDRLREDDVQKAFEDLPDDAPLRVYANVGELLRTDPDTRKALKVKWLDHVTTLGMVADADDEGVAIDYRLATDPEGLGEDDLPMASGDDAPQVLERDEGSAEIVLGLREPRQLIEFAQAAAAGVDPAGFGQFEAAKEQIGKQLDVDVDRDVIGQMTGDLAAVFTLDQSFGVRAGLEDPRAFERTLAVVMDKLPEFADGVTVTKPDRDGSLYGVAAEDGRTYALGVADGSFVLANDPKLAGEVATRGLEDSGGSGALVVAADAEQLANAALAQFGGIQGIGGALFTGPLGELTSSASVETDGLTGRLELALD